MTFDDLQTATIGMVAYWNAYDHGADDIDPIQYADHSTVEEYTQATNGLEGTISRRNNEFHFRIKTDGWIMVWLDIVEEFGSNPYGLFDTLNWNVSYTYPDTDLAAYIDSMAGECVTGASVAKTEIGYYSYHYPDAPYLWTGQAGSNQGRALGFTPGTTFHYCASAGSGVFDGTDTGGNAVDVLAEGLMPDPGVYYAVPADVGVVALIGY